MQDDLIAAHFHAATERRLSAFGPVSEALAEMKKELPLVYRAMQLEYGGEYRQLLNAHARRVEKGKAYVKKRVG